jgi:hypothetical protein
VQVERYLKHALSYWYTGAGLPLPGGMLPMAQRTFSARSPTSTIAIATTSPSPDIGPVIINHASGSPRFSFRSFLFFSFSLLTFGRTATLPFAELTPLQDFLAGTPSLAAVQIFCTFLSTESPFRFSFSFWCKSQEHLPASPSHWYHIIV